MKRFISAILIFVFISVILSPCAVVSNAVDSDSLEKGDIFEYGMYPQSEVKDLDSLSAFESVDVTLLQFPYNYSQGYAKIYYGDFTYEGQRYRKVTFEEERPYSPKQQSLLYSSFMGVHYYKWEPVKWLVLEKGSQSLKAISLNLLDFEQYSDSIENGSYPNITYWLNSYFYPIAFSESEKEFIKSDGNLPEYVKLLSADELDACVEDETLASRLLQADFVLSAGVSEYAYSQSTSNSEFFIIDEYGEANETYSYVPDKTLSEWYTADAYATDIDSLSDMSDYEKLSPEYGVRPVIELERGFSVGGDNPLNYSSHTHSFLRNVDFFEIRLPQEYSCVQAVYYCSCIGCSEYSEDYTFEVEGDSRFHEYIQKVWDEAICTPATYSADATYYLTCKNCGKVDKTSTPFVLKGSHLGEHRFIEIGRESAGECAALIKVDYECSVCGERKTEYESGEGHDFVKLKMRTQQALRCEATTEHNKSYYYTFKCKKCLYSEVDYSDYYEIRGSKLKADENSSTTSAQAYECDINGDGIIDISDISQIISGLGASVTSFDYRDVNKDNIIDVLDISILLTKSYGSISR